MEGENPYRVRPFLVAVLDAGALRKAGRDGHAPSRKARSVIAFLGPVGEKVRAAAARGGRAASEGKRPAPPDAKLLGQEYGPRWAALLGYDLFSGGAVVGGGGGAPFSDDLARLAEDSVIPVGGGARGPGALSASEGPGALGGGADDVFGDLSDFGKTVGDVRRSRRAARQGPSGAQGLAELRDALGPYLSSTVAMYPSDSMADLAERIWAVAEIPPWRLNLSLERPGEEPQHPYDLYLSDVRASIDPSSLYAADGEGRGSETLAGVLPDRRLEQRRTRARAGEPAPVQVRPYDEARLLEYRPGARSHLAWAFDILSAFDLGAAEKAIRDSYARDLLYYGAVMKFWPRIEGPEVLESLFAGREIEGSRVGRLPDTLGDAQRRTEIAQTLMEPAYSAAERRRLPAETVSELLLEGAAPIAGGHGDATVEVVAAFDRVETGAERPAATLALSAPTVSSLAAASGFRRPNRKAQIVQKRYASSYVGSSAREVEALTKAAAVLLGRGRLTPPTASVLVKDDSDFAVVSVSWRDAGFGAPGLRCGARRRWAEDVESRGLEAASEELSAFAVKGLSALGVPMPALGKSAGLRPRTLSASWGWRHALTSEGFRELRAQAKQLEAAGFATTRAAQQPNTIALEWHRGIWDYAPEALARAFSHSKAASRGVANLYAGGDLVSGVVLRAFAGRAVRLIHRATEVRVEVSGVAPSEFEAVRGVLSAFFGTLRSEKILHAQTLSQMDKRSAAAARGKTRRLRKLQETDPKLYDLRLYSDGGRKAPVYAVLCQGDRQPMIYTEAERRRLPDSARRRLVKYWNFTTDGPAFYDCGGPGSAYPYLGFRAGVHPLGYCLPCCKKAPPDSASASASSRATHRRCLAENPDEDPDGAGPLARDAEGEVSATERHVLIFGKNIPPNRLGSLPVQLRTLFSGEGKGSGPPAKLILLGVMQHTPSVPEAGLFYSLASALRREPDAFAERLAETAESLGESLGYFAGGAAAGVPAASVAAAYRSLASGEPEPGVFSPGGALEEKWKDLTAALVREVYQVAHVTFVAGEADGDGPGVAPITFEADRSLLGDGDVDVPVVVTVTRGGTVNPMVALGGRRGVVRETRRLFARGAAVDAEKMTAGEVVAQVVFELVEGGESETSGRDDLPPLNAKKLVELAGGQAKSGRSRTAAESRPAFKIARLYSDLENNYYGGVVTWEGGKAWVPLAGGEASADSEDWPPVVFGARGPDDIGSAEELAQWLARVGREAVQTPRPVKGEASNTRAAAPVRFLVNPEGEAVGFEGRDGMLYYHTSCGPCAPEEAGSSSASESPPGPAPVRLPYDPMEIDQALVESRGSGVKVPREIAALARKGRLRAGRFRLFVAEFARGSQTERNSKLRKAVEGAVRATRFSSSPALAKLRQTLDETLGEHPADADAVRRILIAASTPGEFLKQFGAQWFEFDAVTFHRVRAEPDEGKALAAVQAFMKGRVSVGGDDPAFDPPNFYRACGERGNEPRSAARASRESSGAGGKSAPAGGPSALPEGIPPCRGGKLALPAELLDPYCRLLTDEILRPMELNVVLSSAAGAFEPFRFTERPYEELKITEM